jgi:hypothetical protein
LQPIDDYARRIFTGAIKLESSDYEKFRRLRQLYLSDLDGQVKADNGYYASRLLALNGLKPGDNAKGYEAAWNAYAETDLTPETAALELGCTEKRLLAALAAYAAPPSAPADPVLISLLQTPPVPVRREQWEEDFGKMQDILQGTHP